METTPTSSPSNAVEQARLRKERREAKIKAGGSARLNRITSMGARAAVSEDAAKPGKPRESTPPPPYVSKETEGTATPDPEEVDISQHFYTPGVTSRPGQAAFSSQRQQQQPSDEQLRQLMLGMGEPGARGPQNPFGYGPQVPGMGTGAGEDSMMQMLQQMLGGPGGPGVGGPSPFGAGFPEGMNVVQPQEPDKYAYLWKIIHTFCALALAIYIIAQTPFVGTRAARLEEPSPLQVAPGFGGLNFFWLFATVELMLQSTRFFLEKGRAPPGSWLGTIAAYLPPPFGGYLVMLARYSVIYTTIVEDGLVIIFVLGCVAWWKAGP